MHLGPLRISRYQKLRRIFTIEEPNDLLPAGESSINEISYPAQFKPHIFTTETPLVHIHIDKNK